MKRLIDGMKHYLPQDFQVDFTGSDHDLGSWVLGDDQRTRALELARAGKHFSPEELKELENLRRTPVEGWFSACSMESPANIVEGAQNTTEDAWRQRLIHDHQKTFGFCENPWLKKIHGAMQ